MFHGNFKLVTLNCWQKPPSRSHYPTYGVFQTLKFLMIFPSKYIYKLKIIIVSVLTCCMQIFVHRSGCMLIFIRESCFFFPFFSSRNLCIDYFSRETDFVHGTCCVLIFVREALFVKLRGIFFSLCETCTLIFLLVKLILFIELLACWFFFLETCCMLIFLFLKLEHWFFLFVKLILFMGLAVC